MTGTPGCDGVGRGTGAVHACPACATYAAAEVKVLTETASKVAYALGRKDAGEEIALALEAIPATVYPEDIFLPDSDSVDAQTARVMRFAYPAAARIARDVVSEEPRDASEPRTDPFMGMDLPPEPQAVRSPQERCPLADLDNRCIQFGEDA